MLVLPHLDGEGFRAKVGHPSFLRRIYDLLVASDEGVFRWVLDFADASNDEGIGCCPFRGKDNFDVAGGKALLDAAGQSAIEIDGHFTFGAGCRPAFKAQYEFNLIIGVIEVDIGYFGDEIVAVD